MVRPKNNTIVTEDQPDGLIPMNNGNGFYIRVHPDQLQSWLNLGWKVTE
ncbi:MAG: hypothetical protein WCP20_11000 [Desulfuromonadales bacterium]